MRNKTRVDRLRTIVQTGFFIIVAIIVIAHSLEESGIIIPLISGASLHAICPFGGIVSLYELITAGSFIPKIHASALVLAVLVFVLTLLFGPVFCGWVCPFGTFQQWLAPLGRRLFKKRYGKILPKQADKLLRFVRYGVLIWLVYMTAQSAQLVFADYDPYYALFNFWTGEVAVTGFIALGVVILLSLIVERPFCRYACPYGALLGLFNLIRIFPLKRAEATCIDCKACDKACPMGIEVSTAQTVRDHQCISCLRCTSEAACPVPRTVELGRAPGSDPGTARVVRARVVASIVLVVMLGGILGAMAIGVWTTESTKVPRMITEGELAGVFDPADIRGSYTFGDIEEHFAVPAEVIARAYGFDPAAAAGIQAKLVGETFDPLLEGTPYDIGTDSIKWFVSLYLGYPYTYEEGTALPMAAVELLRQEGRISEEVYDQIRSESAVDISASGIIPVSEEPPAVVPGDSSAAAQFASLTLVGKTTFAQLIEQGVSADQIEQALGFAIPSERAVIRDICEEAGLEFSVFTTALQEVMEGQ